MKILVAEPDRDVAKRLEEIISGEDLETITSNNGIEALDIAKRELPQLVISEINLPGMNGIGLCRLLKNEEIYKDIKVIFLINPSGIEYVEYVKKAGADGIILKPFEKKRNNLGCPKRRREMRLSADPRKSYRLNKLAHTAL